MATCCCSGFKIKSNHADEIHEECIRPTSKMVLQKRQVSSQYLRKGEIAVTILDICNPAHYVLKECPTLDASTEAKHFVEAEEAMQKYYESVEPGFFQLPLKDSIIVAQFKNKFYRAKVIRILTMSAGHLFQVYFVDYGIERSVERNCIYEIEKDFLVHPFQSIEFKLLGLEPVSLVMDTVSLAMSYGPVSGWDLSADTFVKDLRKRMCSAYIQVQAIDKEYIYGKLFICFSNSIPKCINDELISNKFAGFNEDCWKTVQKIESILENNHAEVGNFQVESLSIGSDPKQMPTNQCTMKSGLSDFKMMFVRPSDGKVIAESSLKEEKIPVNVEKDCQSEANIDYAQIMKWSNAYSCFKDTKDSTVWNKTLRSRLQKYRSFSPPQTVDNVPHSNLCKESKSPLSASKGSSEEQKIYKESKSLSASKGSSEEQKSVAERHLLKLRQLHKKQLDSPSLKKDDCTAQKDFTENAAYAKTSTNNKSPNLDKQSNFSNIVNKPALENSSNHSVFENHAIAQRKLLKLQQLHKKRLSSPILLANAQCATVKNSSIDVETTADIKQLTHSVPAEKLADTAKLPFTDASRKTIHDKTVSSDDCNNSHDSCQSNNLNSTILENKLKEETKTKEQLIAHKRLLKLQQLCRKKPQSSLCLSDENFSCIKSSPSVNVTVDNEPNISANGVENQSVESTPKKHEENLNYHLSASESHVPVGTQSKNASSQSDVVKDSIKISAEFHLKSEEKSEVVLEHVKTLQKLQNRIRLKQSLPNLEKSTGLKFEESFENKRALSKSSNNISMNENQIQSSSSTPTLLTEKQTDVNQKSTNRKSEIVITNLEKLQANDHKSETHSEKYINKPMPNLESQENKTNEASLKTAGKDLKSPTSHSSRSSVLFSDDSSSASKSPSYPGIPNCLLNSSDSDELLNVQSKKEDHISDVMNVEESFIELSIQRQCSKAKSINFKEKSLWEKRKVPVLQIGASISPPVLNLGDIHFSNHVKKVLKEVNFYSPSCIQSVVWPAIAKNRSVIMVAPPHSGKTLSYILPLVSFLTAEGISLPKGKGPYIIILCSSWVKAEGVYNFFHCFLQDTNIKITTLSTYGGIYMNKLLPFLNDCDILVATPFCLLKFLKEKCIYLARCKHFILDDGTTQMKKNKKELKNIFLCLMDSAKNCQSYPQLVLCAERWDKNFEIIRDKLMLGPELFFTSFLESAIYAKVPIFAHVCNSTKKESTLLNVLQNFSSGKVVVCTTNVHKAIAVHRFLRCEDIISFLINEEMERFIADEVVKDWKSTKCMSSSHCLIITDPILIDMHISNANCLVHYDIPPESRLQFGNRFSCIAEHFDKMDKNPECVCHIFIEESEYVFAPQLIEIIENSGGTPSEDLIDIAQKHDKIGKNSGTLCQFMKAFGFCKKPRCQNRHYIDPESDKPVAVPWQGDIEALVTHIIDASHYYVRILKYLDPITNKTTSLINRHAEIGFQLKEFFQHASEEMIEKSPVVGDCYILAEENNLFYRIKILEFMAASSNNLPAWKVLFLDEGWVKCYNKFHLYKITDKINLPAPLTVEVYACKILTPDSCFEWNPQTSYLVEDLIGGKKIHGKIVLCIGSVLWLDPIVLRKELANANEYVNLFKLNQKLLEYGHVRLNKNHLQLLKKACGNKISFPCFTKSIIKKEETPKLESSISHAFLDLDVIEDVYVTSVVSPHQFYVQRAKFADCLDKLIEEITKQIEKKMLKKCFTLQKGMHCIAPFQDDNRYYRAVITDVISYNEVYLFYVDFGDTGKTSRDNIYFLPMEYLLLPFQAIECELAGIAAAHGGWTDSAASAVVTFTRDEADDMKIVQTKAYTKRKCYEGGNHYVINIWINGKSLSEQLLQAGLGISTDISLMSSNKVLSDHFDLSSSEAFDLNDRYSTSTDEERHPDDKDSEAFFYGFLAKMVAKEYNLVSTDEEEILESLKKSVLPVASDVSDKINKLLPKIKQADENIKFSETCSKSLKPLITWWDTPENLTFVINLKRVKVYQLDITDEKFDFNTIISGNQYSAAEKFYATIYSHDANINQNSEGINIVVKKCTPFKWPRLTKEKRKFLHIKYDLIHIEDSDPDVQSEDTKKLSIPPPYIEESSSSSTDEDEKYVQSWKDFAQNFDPLDLIT